ncbi:MAG: class I SAM-dependent methyltransferase [Deltaproteobacteria bacterium]|nr:class I SAM-dependent methyltransferase [Deltaproteobacteria bacterium]
MKKLSFPMSAHKRFLSNNPVAYEKAIQSAKSYVSQMEEGSVLWLYCKPFDAMAHNPEYFRLMYDLLNLIQKMQITPQGRILEVGSGPGWVTEILLMLGFKVDAIEPSEDLTKIARERCKALEQHYHRNVYSNVYFHATTLEEIEFKDEQFDAIIFFDVLHHIVDEEIALEKCFRFLKRGGTLGISEGAWHPDFKAVEEYLLQEMRKYGTLENPFSVKYLDYLLDKYGFIDITRCVSVNGLFSEEQLSQPLHNFIFCQLKEVNNIIARRPYGNYPNCYQLNFKTDARINILAERINSEARTASLDVRIENTGDTFWCSCGSQTGYVTIALRQGLPEAANFIEAQQRYIIARSLIPGDALEMTLIFNLPINAPLENWELDLVCEGFFWFSSRGIQSCPILTFPPKTGPVES